MAFSLFKKSSYDLYAPKQLKFSDIYQHNTKDPKGPHESVKEQAKAVLRKAGWSEQKIYDTITYDKKIPLDELKSITNLMHQAGLYGFERDPNLAVKALINKVRVKNESIARRIKENILERSEEAPASSGAISLSGRDVSPNASDESIIKSLRYRAGSQAKRSLSAAADGGRKTSLTDLGHTASSLSGKGAGSTGKMGVSSPNFRPKF